MRASDNLEEAALVSNVDLGPRPQSEPPQWPTRGTVSEDVGLECRAFIWMLRRILGTEPSGAWLGIGINENGFTVLCRFFVHDDTAAAYAFNLESHIPQNWDKEASVDLEALKKRSI
jgi:hypothetical protein